MDGGNSQELDAADPEPEASVPEIDSGLDPTVTFQWTETLPGPGTCGPNTFVGSFSCTSESRLTPFVGQMTLVVSSVGESMLVVTGKLADAAGFELFFSASIQGTLECGMNMLTAWTTDGRAAYFGVEATFETDILGVYDPKSLEIVGELTLIITYDDVMMTEAETCRGSFQVGAPL